MRWGWLSMVGLAVGCSAPNGLFDPDIPTADAGDTIGAATIGAESGNTSTTGSDGPGSQTSGGTESSTGSDSGGTTSGGAEECQGLFHVQLSSSEKPQLPRALNTAAGPMVFFVDSDRAIDVSLWVATFEDGYLPSVQELPTPWVVDRSFLLAEGPGGLAAVLDSPPVLLSADLAFNVIDSRPVVGLGQFPTSGLARMGSDWIIPTIPEENFALLRYPDGAKVNDIGVPESGVAWVAGRGGAEGGAYVYRTAIGATCWVLSLTPPDYGFDNTSLLTSEGCLAPTLAFDFGDGGLATFYRGGEGASQILGQLLGPNGSPLDSTAEFQIAEGIALHHPAVVQLESGDYWVVWDSGDGMQAALLDGGDPTTVLHTTELFGEPTTFRKRAFTIDGRPAVVFHSDSPFEGSAGVHVVIDCDAR